MIAREAGHDFVPCDDDPLECVYCRAQEPRCESQGCCCSPSLPCDEDLCDGQQYDDGSTVSCTMCVRERAEMMEQS